MPERNLDFDTVIDRRGSKSLKFDFAVERGRPKDILPLWVADMDFKVSSYIEDALVERARHGIFGYTETDDSYFDAVAGWFKRRHGFVIEKGSLIKTSGVVPALGNLVSAFTERGEGVLVQKPVYYCFIDVIELSGRRVVNNELYIGEDGKFHIDFEDFEKKIVENKVRLFLLCNPHNPGGRSWTQKELLKMGEICVRHNVIVVSDEIHADFVYSGHKHIVFETLSEEIRNITITCTSAGKTFNISGLQNANIIVHNKELYKRFKRELEGIGGYSQANTMGIFACEAAYKYGDEWYEAMFRYIQGNLQFLKDYLKKELPQISMMEPEATYLVLLDFRSLHLSENGLEDLIVNKAGLWLDSGAIFGRIGEGFERINIGCSRVTLKLALDKLKHALS